MNISIAALIRSTAESTDSRSQFWASRMQDVYGIDISPSIDFSILRDIYRTISIFPPSLIKACGITRMEIREDMGPNRPYYPNHGYFVNHTVALNADIFRHPDQPDDFMDHRGYFLTRPSQTLYHEWGHGYDEYNGSPSLKDDWLRLSGWSKEQQPGLKRLIIRDSRAPEVIGEWWYSPEAKFTRFYGKKNPYDDFADCFSFYVGGLRSKVPENKKQYLDKMLAAHYA